MDKSSGKDIALEAPVRRKRAKRLDPAVRQELILDAATRLIEARNAANFTLDDVAAEADVSRPLIHRYFATRDHLLEALLKREFDLKIGRPKGLVPDDAATEDAHKIYIERHFEYLKERGRFFHLLVDEARAENGIAAKAADDHTWSATGYWVKRTMETYGIPATEARLGMMMTISALKGAEGTLRLEKMTPAEAADLWATFILAGWKAVAEKYGSDADADADAE